MCWGRLVVAAENASRTWVEEFFSLADAVARALVAQQKAVHASVESVSERATSVWIHKLAKCIQRQDGEGLRVYEGG